MRLAGFTVVLSVQFQASMSAPATNIDLKNGNFMVPLFIPITRLKNIIKC